VRSLLLAGLIGIVLLFAVPGAAAGGGRWYHDAARPEAQPLTGHAHVSAQSVLGPDDREHVGDTTVFPYSAIAYIELQGEQGEVLGSCTGTFIGPDSVLTAAHCLWDAGIQDWLPAHIRVAPGKDGDFEPFGSEFAADWWVPDGYTPNGASDWDWGVLKLPDNLLSSDTGWLAISVASTGELQDTAFDPTIVGYPADKPEGTMWGMQRPGFIAVEAFHLFYDLDTSAGESGAAIWSGAEGAFLHRVVGIHTNGGDRNSGSRIDDELLQDLETACEVMACTIDVQAPELPAPAPLSFHSFGVAVARD
jgi:glutamyl endopeptidase